MPTTDPGKTEKTFVTAGAGAGKTTALVAHIVETFLTYKKTHKRWPRVIGTTFTRKAANEIKERVAQKAEQKNLDQEELLNFAYSDHLNITTIHGICLQIIMKKAYLLGFSTQVKVISPTSLRFYQKRLLFKFLEQDLYSSLYERFKFDEILKIFENLDENLRQGFKPATKTDLEKIYKDVLLDLKNKAQKPLFDFPSEDLQKLGEKAEKIKTYVQDLQVAFRSAFEVNDLKPVHQVFCDGLRAPNKNLVKDDPVLSQKYDELKDFINSYKDKYNKKFETRFEKSKLKDAVLVNDLLFDLYQKFSQRVFDYKKEKSFVLMSDVEPLCLKILEEFPEDCKDYIDLWDYWYIDEYQDTSQVQKSIFDILLKDKNFYKVGDPQQSIYLFRGAQSSLFLQEKKVSENDDQVNNLSLEINYRSNPNLMKAINTYFQHIQDSNLDLQESFKEMQLKGELDSEQGKRFKLIKTDDSAAEVEFVTDQIQNLIKEGVSYSDICVLGRTKSILEKCELRLVEKKIPSLAQFSGGFVKRPEILGLIAFLSLMKDPNDDESLIQILRTQCFKIDDDTLATWCEEAKSQKKWSLWDYIQTKEHEVIESIKKLQKVFQEQDYAQGMKAYLAHTQAFFSGYDEIDYERRKANLIKVYAFLCSFYENASYNLESLILDLEQGYHESLNSEARFSNAQSGVRLFTIHGSKGLEFDHVFVIGCGLKPGLDYHSLVEISENYNRFFVPIPDKGVSKRFEGPLPHTTVHERVLQQKKELRRLIYVASTRAKESLYLVGSLKEGKNKRITYSESVFGFSAIDKIPSQSLSKDLQTQVSETEHPLLEWMSVLDLFLEGTQKEDENLNSSYQKVDFTKFQNLRREYAIKDKKIYQHASFMQDLSLKTESNLQTMSVSSLVEKIIENHSEMLKFQEKKETAFSALKIDDMLSLNYKLNYQMQSFIKPFTGDIFHKAIELYTKGVAKEELQNFLQSYFGLAADKVLQSIESMLAIKEPDMAQILKNSYSEWGFNALLEGRTFVSGQIDLWGHDKDQNIHIVDYKTGSDKHIRKAACQLALYKKVLQARFFDKQIFTHVIYLTQGRWIRLEVEESLIDCTQI